MSALNDTSAARNLHLWHGRLIGSANPKVSYPPIVDSQRQQPSVGVTPSASKFGAWLPFDRIASLLTRTAGATLLAGALSD
jgi:hypothetical protein